MIEALKNKNKSTAVIKLEYVSFALALQFEKCFKDIYVEFKSFDLNYFESISNPHPILMDIKGLYPASNSSSIKHWRL